MHAGTHVERAGEDGAGGDGGIAGPEGEGAAEVLVIEADQGGEAGVGARGGPGRPAVDHAGRADFHARRGRAC